MRTLYVYRERAGKRQRYAIHVDESMTVQSLERVEDTPTSKVKSPIRQEIIPFFVDSSPCWFPGCEELREEYRKELEKLGSNCPGCQRGALMRKFAPRVEDAIKNS